MYPGQQSRDPGPAVDLDNCFGEALPSLLLGEPDTPIIVVVLAAVGPPPFAPAAQVSIVLLIRIGQLKIYSDLNLWSLLFKSWQTTIVIEKVEWRVGIGSLVGNKFRARSTLDFLQSLSPTMTVRSVASIVNSMIDRKFLMAVRLIFGMPPRGSRVFPPL